MFFNVQTEHLKNYLFPIQSIFIVFYSISNCGSILSELIQFAFNDIIEIWNE
jgi:hypothetical protein